MTTPARLRRRQIRNDWFIAILAAALVAGWLYFQGEASAQKRCLLDYIASNSRTSAIRADQVEHESKATKRFLLNATDPEKVKTRAQFLRVRNVYATAMHDVDAARAANPIEPFHKGECD